MAEGHMNQISPIEIHNPNSNVDERDAFGTCLCCGQSAQTHGVCLNCVQKGCNVDLDVACKRTGEVDPCDIRCPDSVADLLDL